MRVFSSLRGLATGLTGGSGSTITFAVISEITSSSITFTFTTVLPLNPGLATTVISSSRTLTFAIPLPVKVVSLSGLLLSEVGAGVD